MKPKPAFKITVKPRVNINPQPLNPPSNSVSAPKIGSIQVPSLSTRTTSDDIPKVLNHNSLLLKPSDPQMEYRRREKEIKQSVHWGQLKLALAVLSFITYYWDPDEVPEPILVYAGAAPGDNINLLIDLFPQFKEWHLFDPRHIVVKPVPGKVFVYSGEENGYFTDEYAQKFAGRNDIYFVSDIRVGGYRGEISNKEFEQGVWKDNKMQQKWVQIIRPLYAHLKFRLPYPGNNLPQFYQYFDGDVLKQPWVGPTSTETRLVVSNKNMELIGWDNVVYQNQLFYHNKVIRENTNYTCKYSDKPLIGTLVNEQPVYQLIQDWDSMMTIQVLGDYLIKAGYQHKFNTDPNGFQHDIENLFLYIVRLLNRDLPDSLRKLSGKYTISPAILRVVGVPESKEKYKDYNSWLLGTNSQTDGLD